MKITKDEGNNLPHSKYVAKSGIKLRCVHSSCHLPVSPKASDCKKQKPDNSEQQFLHLLSLLLYVCHFHKINVKME